MIKIYNADDYTMSNLQIVIQPTKAEIYKNDEGEYYADVTIPITQNIAGREVNCSPYFVQDNIIVVDTPDGEQAFRINNPIKTTRGISTKANHIFLDTKKYLITDIHNEMTGNLFAIFPEIFNYLPTYFGYDLPATVQWSDSAHIKLGDNVQWGDNAYSFITVYDAIKSTLENIVFTNPVGETDRTYKIRFDNNIAYVYYISKSAEKTSDIIIENAKNLSSIQISENWDEVCTTCLALGYNDLRATYTIPNNPYPYHYGRVIQFEPSGGVDTTIDAEIIADLQTQAENYVNEHLYPLINYQVTANIDTKIDIGDPIKVKHNQLGVDILTEIISFKWNALTKRYTQIEYGNYKPNVKGYANKTNDRIKRLEMRIGQGGL